MRRHETLWRVYKNEYAKSMGFRDHSLSSHGKNLTLKIICAIKTTANPHMAKTLIENEWTILTTANSHLAKTLDIEPMDYRYISQSLSCKNVTLRINELSRQLKFHVL